MQARADPDQQRDEADNEGLVEQQQEQRHADKAEGAVSTTSASLEKKLLSGSSGT